MTLFGENFEKQPLNSSASSNLSIKRSSLKNGGDIRRSSVTFASTLREDDDLIRPLTLNTVNESAEMNSNPNPIVKNARKPMARIPTEAKLKTITHKVKRPAVDIEFHDLVYTAKTTTGEYLSHF